MGIIVSDVLAKIKTKVPECSGRWSDTHVNKMIHLADTIIREAGEMSWVTKTIDLSSGAMYYAIPNDVIWVGAVEFAQNGTDFTDQHLVATTMNELDRLDPMWETNYGTEPTHYFLLGTPGQSTARIAIWRAIETVTTEKIRLTVLQSLPGYNLAFVSSADAFPAIQDTVYVPLTLSLLYGTLDSDAAKRYAEQAYTAMPKVRGLYQSKYEDVISQLRDIPPSSGQLR